VVEITPEPYVSDFLVVPNWSVILMAYMVAVVAPAAEIFPKLFDALLPIKVI
jgi:hypothetical protein